MNSDYLPIIYALGAIFLLWIIISACYRSVVPTNMVHIVQSSKKTTSYGTGQTAGNVYYSWPNWFPRIGIAVIKLPVSNFDLSLKDYEAYDRDRVPFMVDVTAFFRVVNTTMAAQRVKSIEELINQLHLIVQGAVRKVLASDVIDVIMLERSKFGNMFTDEVKEQLAEWGIESVKSMELMDIRDGRDSRVISNIMAKKTSHIEMQSRQEVAANMQSAELAEIEATQAVDIRKQEAEQAVGERTADKNKAVGIALQKSEQEILTEQKETKTRDMDVKKVEMVKLAEITKEQQLVFADQQKQTTIITSVGALEAKRNEATGIEVEGAAKATAAKLMQLAPVEAQIALAKEIGANAGYQNYLAIIESVKAYIAVGSKQAEALTKADVKIISNTGNASEGMKGVMNLFTSQGGTNLAAMIEAFAQSPLGESFLSAIGVGAGNIKKESEEEIKEPKEEEK